jgi:hypothetical protein
MAARKKLGRIDHNPIHLARLAVTISTPAPPDASIWYEFLEFAI